MGWGSLGPRGKLWPVEIPWTRAPKAWEALPFCAPLGAVGLLPRPHLHCPQ